MKLEIGKEYYWVNDPNRKIKIIARVDTEEELYWAEVQNKPKNYCLIFHPDGRLYGGCNGLYSLKEKPLSKELWAHLVKNESDGELTWYLSADKKQDKYFVRKLIGRKKITLTEGEFDD